MNTSIELKSDYEISEERKAARRAKREAKLQAEREATRLQMVERSRKHEADRKVAYETVYNYDELVNDKSLRDDAEGIAQFWFNRIEQRIDQANKSIDAFIEDLRKDPAYALSWSKGQFEQAANRKVFMIVRELLREGRTIEQVLGYAREETLRGAGNVESSTSHASNLMERYELHAWSTLARNQYF